MKFRKMWCFGVGFPNAVSSGVNVYVRERNLSSIYILLAITATTNSYPNTF